MNGLEHLLETLNALLALALLAYAWLGWRRSLLRLQRLAVRLIGAAMTLFALREVLTLIGRRTPALSLARELSETLTILAALAVVWALQRSAQQEIGALQEEARRDALTGLFNRRHFTRLAQKALSGWSSDLGEAWLILMDVDNFKDYNDTFGHAAGDRVLKRIASVLRASVRKSDLVARYGGEEFMALIFGTLEAPHAVIERIQANMRLMCQPDEEIHRQVTLSLGVARWSPEQGTLEAMIRAADRALYRAKWSGKNQACFFDPALDGETTIVHLCSRAVWEAAQQAGEYRPPSLDREGFIHCSRPEQIQGVVERFFRDVSDLVLLWIDPLRVQAPIRWEAADGDTFPHIYGPLNLDAVQRVTPYHAAEEN